MNSFADGSVTNTDTNDPKSNSTIQLQFSEPLSVRLRPTARDDSNNNGSHTFLALQPYELRKRSASTSSEQTTNGEEIRSRKFRTREQDPHDRQCVSLSETEEMKTRSNRSLSIANGIETNFEWLKDFMNRSIDRMRETVVQACVTAISTQSTATLHACPSTRDRNLNNYPIRFVRSEHSLVSPKPRDSDHEQPYLSGQTSRVHQRARSRSYPLHASVLRTPMSDNQVSWSWTWPHYQPTVFTAAEVHVNPGADPDLLRSSAMSSLSLRFNAVDGAIDRRSIYRPYSIDEQTGLPLNPIGRTGLRGRGILLRWGPNVYHYVLICRWKRDMHGRTLVHPLDGKRMLEILLEVQSGDDESDELILTGGLRMLGSHFPPQLQDRLKRFLAHAADQYVPSQDTRDSSLLALDHLFDQSPTPWKGAYFDDARNTDNAWIELSIEYLLDDNHALTPCIPSLSGAQLHRLAQPRFVWTDVRRTMDVRTRTHYRLIKNLACKLEAYF